MRCDELCCVELSWRGAVQVQVQCSVVERMAVSVC